MLHAPDMSAPVAAIEGGTSLYLLLIGLMSVVMLVVLANLMLGRLHIAKRSGALRVLVIWLLSDDPQQQRVGLRFLVAAANCLTGILALNYGRSLGVIDAGDCANLSAAALLVLTLCYVVLRSGLNRRLSDPSMVEPQTWSTIGFLAWGYLIGGPGQAVALMLVCVILMFSMFTNTTRQLIRSSVLTALLFGAAMARLAALQSGTPNGPQLQAVHFMVLVVVLISVCLLVNELARLRQSAEAHKAELQAALGTIQELATRDELTGLFNRRHMLEVLNTERHRSKRSGRPFCLGLIDVDHFKAVNDRHGHRVGDEVLCTVARVITEGLRETDRVARWGGEEFLIFFTDTDCETAERVLLRIQHNLTHTAVSADTPGLRITFSAGLSRHEPDDLLTRTIDLADKGLYAAKAAGRNAIRHQPGCGHNKPDQAHGQQQA